MPRRRRRRQPRVLVAAASAVLLAAVVGLWVRSYYAADTLVWTDSAGRMRELALLPGEVRFIRCTGDGVGRRPFEHLTTIDGDRVLLSRRWLSESPTRAVAYDEWPESIFIGGFPGPRPTGRDPTIDFVVHRFAVRCWVLVTLLAALPAVRLVAAMRRPPPGHCQSCGYDLTANISGRCPECGADVPGAAAGGVG